MADINVLKQKVKANDVSAGEVKSEYFPDERAGEFSWEEFRFLAVNKLYLSVDRVKT